MKRVYIVVEGQTEQEFVNSVISPYLRSFGILSVTPVLVRTSRTGRGGMVNYSHLANTIKPLLMSRRSSLQKAVGHKARLQQSAGRQSDSIGNRNTIHFGEMSAVCGMDKGNHWKG